MANLNPDHLLDQADRLISSGARGQPRRVDLRRAISAAYYAGFHFILAAAADLLIGANKRAAGLYTLVYRSMDHRNLRDLCEKAGSLSRNWAQYAPANGFDANIPAFARAVLELQAKRADADYNPSIRVNSSDAKLAVDTARTALTRFQGASEESRRTFLGLLVFRPR